MSNSSKETILHAENWIGDGATLCGDVMDGDPAVGLHPAMFAHPGERVTCSQCLLAIQHSYAFYTPNGKRR